MYTRVQRNQIARLGQRAKEKIERALKGAAKKAVDKIGIISKSEAYVVTISVETWGQLLVTNPGDIAETTWGCV